MIVTTKASSCSGKALAEEDPLSRRKVANEQTGEPRSLRSSRGRFSSGSGTATGPRDTASDPNPVRLPLCPRWPRSEGSLALFAAPATQRAPPPNIGRQERGRRGSRRPSHPAPGAPRPLHPAHPTPRPASRPARQPAGAAVAPPSEPTAYSHSGASRRKPPRAPGGTVRAGATLTRPTLATSARAGGGGGDTEPAEARARVLARPGRRAGPRLTKYNGCQRH